MMKIDVENHPCANPQCKTCKGLGIVKYSWWDNISTMWQRLQYLDMKDKIRYIDCPDCIEIANYKPHYGELGHGE